MNGYIAVVHRRGDNGYEVRFPDLAQCRCSGPTMAEALSRAGRALENHVEELLGLGTTPPAVRPSHELAAVAQRLDAVAAVCLKPPGSFQPGASAP